MREVISICIVICLCALAITTPALAEVYRWVDSQGKIHYGDRAPSELRDKAKPVNIKVETNPLDPEAEKARQQLRSIEEGRQRERAFEAQKLARQHEQQAQLTQRCHSLQNEIRNDENIAVFFRYDESGKRVLWTAEERVAYREKLQNLKQAYCADQPD